MATIMLVDDEEITLNIVEKILELGGHEVIRKSNGVDALAELQTNSAIELVITDIRMPGLDGRDLTFAIRGMPATADLPVVLMSGAFNQDDFADLLKHPSTAFIAKPVRMEHLLTLLKGIFGDWE